MNDVNRPVDPKFWSVWPTIGWSAAITLLWIIVQTFTVITATPLDPNLPREEAVKLLNKAAEDGALVSMAVIISSVVGGAAIALVVKLRQGFNFSEYLELKPVSREVLLRWLAYSAVFVAAFHLITLALGRETVPQVQITLYSSANPKWIFWIAVLFAGPIFEEMLFRGFLFRGLMSSRLAKSGAIFLASLSWALLHVQYDAYGIVEIFALGILLGVARVKTQSLYVPIAMHALNNFVSTVVTAMSAP